MTCSRALFFFFLSAAKGVAYRPEALPSCWRGTLGNMFWDSTLELHPSTSLPSPAGF